MNTREVAERLGMSPKSLRRYLRSNARWAAQEGRYAFTEADVEQLLGELKRPPTPEGDDDVPGWTVDQMHDPKLRRQRLATRAMRQAKLRDRLMELSLWGVSSEEL